MYNIVQLCSKPKILSLEEQALKKEIYKLVTFILPYDNRLGHFKPYILKECYSEKLSFMLN